MRYPTIPHLFGSASDPGDVVLSPAQTREFLRGPVTVYEKLDGLNVGLCFTGRGALRFVSRSHGAVPGARLGPSLWPLLDFAYSHLTQLLPLLGARFALFGEWLAGPSRLAYPRRDVDFVGFDLFDRVQSRFLPPDVARRRIERSGLPAAQVRFTGRVDSVPALLELVPRSRFGGPAEGVVVTGAGGARAKVVREAWARLALRSPVPTRPASLRPPASSGSFTKHFVAARRADAQLEATVLRALAGTRVAPRLLQATVDSSGATTLSLSHVPGRRFPRRAAPALAASLGVQLARLHDTHVAAPPLKGAPAAQVLAAAGKRDLARARRLAGFLAAQGGLGGALALCHADLKPENLRVRGGAVTLLDFERARLADPAWELACAMDRLDLDAAARSALLHGYGERAPPFAVRVQCFRRAWDFVLPHAVSALHDETGRRPSATALRLADAARARAAELDRALVAFRRAQ